MSSSSAKCVLVVDDDDYIRGVVSEGLEQGGYRVEVAYDGEQALAMVSTTQPDAIVLDVMMPVMDGWAFLKRCQTDPECGGTPVLVMSAHPKLKETAGEFHVGYLAKPFDMDVLLGTLGRLIQPPSG